MGRPKALVLLSGGLDSSVLLAHVVDNYGADNVTALNIFYGQKHAKEMECAEYQAKKHGVTLINADLAQVFKYDTSNPLLQGGTEVPNESYADQLKKMGGHGTVSTYIPFRNGLFLSYAASIALQLKANIIFYGAHADDAAGSAYPDCTKRFIDAMDEAIYSGSGTLVRINAPFWYMGKKDVVKRGMDLGVDFAHTWSCYNGKEKPCGTCATCIDRVAAFKANGIEDPTI